MALDRLEGLACEIEATYNTDPTIVLADDSQRTRNLEVVPLDGEFINRNLDRANLGAEGDILGFEGTGVLDVLGKDGNQLVGADLTFGNDFRFGFTDEVVDALEEVVV